MTERLPFPEHAWPLMKRALEHIAAHPDEFWMDHYVVTSGADVYGAVDEYETVRGRPFPACGTVACLAGRILIEDGYDPHESYFDSGKALRSLGLPVVDMDGVLFHDDEVGRELTQVFEDTAAEDYAELAEALVSRFTFPEPLPAIPAAVSS